MSLAAYAPGDTNNDGKINAFDISNIQKHMLDLEELTDDAFNAADTNGDGKINALDIGNVQSHMLGIAPLPTPDTATIRFWQAGADTADAQNIMKSLLDKFKEETGITVEYQAHPWSTDPHTVFDTALVGEDVADLLVVGNPREFVLAGNDQILPLDDYITDEVKADLMGVFANECIYYGDNAELNGKYISMPLFGDARTILYNKAIFDAKQMEYPDESWTMEEFYENAKALTGKYEVGGTEKTVYGFATSAYYASQYLPFFWNLGAEILTEDNTASAVKANDAWKQGMEYYLKFFEDKITPPGSEAANLADFLAMFMDDQVAMMVATSDYATQILATEGWADKLGVGYMPNVDGLATAFAGADVFVIPKIAQYPEQAARLINFLLRTDNSLEYAMAVGFIPAVKSAAEDPAYKDDPIKSVFADAVNNGKFYVKISNAGSITTLLREEIQLLIAGDNDIDTYLNNVEERINQALAE